VGLGDGLVGDLVGGLFDGLDGGDVLLGPGEVVHQGNQLVGAEDDLLGVVVEEFKKRPSWGNRRPNMASSVTR
jgi:hypothetical protein